jgi:chromosome segregation ATPase
MGTEEKSPLDEFLELYNSIKDKFELLPSNLAKLSEFSNKLVSENKQLSSKVKELDEKYVALEKEHTAKVTEIEKAEKSAVNYKEQLEKVEEQLSGLRKMYEDLTQERAKDIEIEELLAIYTVLFEKVFAADPHTKILILLQGVDKEVWTRDELVKTTNFTPAAIIKALHDLRNNDIVELDESANEVKLIQRVI